MKASLPARIVRAWSELTPQGGRVMKAWNAFQGKRGADPYQGAAMNRLLIDWMAQTMTPDQEVFTSIRKLRARARDLARNNGYAKQYLRLLVVNLIGPNGMTLQSRVPRGQGQEQDEEVNNRIETAWREWTKTKVTVDGKLNFRQLQVLLLQTKVTDGEVFVRKFVNFAENPHRFALQAIDADMLDETYNRSASDRENEIRMGVEVDSLGRPVAYHFFEKPRLGDFVGGGGRVRVPADDILHLYDPARANQTRGVTWLHAGMWPLQMLNGYEESEAVAARVSAAKMGFFVNKDGAAGAGDVKDVDIASGMDAAPGTMEQLPAGLEFQAWDPQHPTASVWNFIKACLRKIASAFGVSYNSLANDLEGVNYSSLRDGRLSERDHYRMLQEDWKDSFVQPVFETWIATALLAGALALPSRDFRRYASFANWGARGWQWVDPLKDIAASEKEIGLGVTSRTEICREAGKDYEQVVIQLAREQELAAKHGVDVSGFKTGAGAQQQDDEEDNGTGSSKDEEQNGKNGGRAHVAGRRF